MTAMVLNSMGVPPASRMPPFDVLGELAQMRSARHDLDPGVRDADQRLGEVFVGKTDRLEHRARGRPRRSIDQHTGIGAQSIVSHLGSSPPII